MTRAFVQSFWLNQYGTWHSPAFYIIHTETAVLFPWQDLKMQEVETNALSVFSYRLNMENISLGMG